MSIVYCYCIKINGCYEQAKMKVSTKNNGWCRKYYFCAKEYDKSSRCGFTAYEIFMKRRVDDDFIDPHSLKVEHKLSIEYDLRVKHEFY